MTDRHGDNSDRDGPRGDWRIALGWSVALSVLFLIVYGGCNWISSRRSDVGILWFEWERAIPLVPAMIVPYMSIDLFFVAAPFLCRGRWELGSHVGRVTTATLLAGACFLVMPLEMVGERPQFSGFFGMLHDLLKAGDRPHNLFPSLHVAYTIILWAIYGRHLRGAAAGVLHVWFVLVIVSVLPVKQHHVIDMAGGAGLALVSFYAFPRRPPVRASGFRPRPAIGLRYLLGAGALGLTAFAIGAWALLGLWPAASLVLVAAAYFGLGPSVFRKSGGGLSPSARIVLGPYLAGLGLSRRWYWRRDAAWCEIVPGLVLGRSLRRREARAVVEGGVEAVLDLTAEHAETRSLRRLPYANVQMLDLAVPGLDQLDEAVAFIRDHEGRTVYVHCGLGYSRSALVAAAHLLACGLAGNVEQACDIVRRSRPGAVLNRDLVSLLVTFNEQLVRARASERATP